MPTHAGYTAPPDGPSETHVARMQSDADYRAMYVARRITQAGEHGTVLQVHLASELVPDRAVGEWTAWKPTGRVRFTVDVQAHTPTLEPA